jgi:hypothetical protein
MAKPRLCLVRCAAIFMYPPQAVDDGPRTAVWRSKHISAQTVAPCTFLKRTGGVGAALLGRGTTSWDSLMCSYIWTRRRKHGAKSEGQAELRRVEWLTCRSYKHCFLVTTWLHTETLCYSGEPPQRFERALSRVENPRLMEVYLVDQMLVTTPDGVCGREIFDEGIDLGADVDE